MNDLPVFVKKKMGFPFWWSKTGRINSSVIQTIPLFSLPCPNCDQKKGFDRDDLRYFPISRNLWRTYSERYEFPLLMWNLRNRSNPSPGRTQIKTQRSIYQLSEDSVRFFLKKMVFR